MLEVVYFAPYSNKLISSGKIIYWERRQTERQYSAFAKSLSAIIVFYFGWPMQKLTGEEKRTEIFQSQDMTGRCTSVINMYIKMTKSTCAFSLGVSSVDATVLAWDGFRLIHIRLGLNSHKAQLHHGILCHIGSKWLVQLSCVLDIYFTCISKNLQS